MVYVNKIVTCYKTEWREEEVPVQVCKAVPHVLVQVHKCTVLVPDWKEVKRTYIQCKSVPVEVWKDVVCCKMVPVCVTDPCTGCTYMSCKPETYVTKVKSICCKLVPEQVEYTCKVCTYHPEERTYQTRCVVCDYKTETVVVKKRYCVSVPYTATVKVAVTVPCVRSAATKAIRSHLCRLRLSTVAKPQAAVLIH